MTSPPSPPDFDGQGWTSWIPAAFQWLTTVGKPLLVGVPLLAVLLGVVGYFAVRGGWRCHAVYAWRARRRKRLARTQLPS